MKKKLLLTVVLIFVITLTSVSVFAKQKEDVFFPKIVDHMNVNKGEQIPEWVTDIIEFNYDSAKKRLGLKDTDMIFIVCKERDSLEDVLLEGKILSYVEFIRSIRCTIFQDPDNYPEITIYKNSSFFGCREILEMVYSYELIQTKHEYYYLTPFGIMQGSLHRDEATSYFSKKDNFIKIDIKPEGKLNCPSEYETFFKWFRNEENVQINQFWTKTQITDNSETYNCITVLSISKENYEKISQLFLEQMEIDSKITDIGNFLK